MLTPVHIQNTDTILDEGGLFEVSASELRNFLDNNTLDFLDDVSVTSPTDGQVLTYVGGSLNEWQAQDATGGSGSGISSLGGETGVTQTLSTVNGTNVTIGISSVANDHEFTVGWQSVLAITDGGTGQATPQLAIDALAGFTTRGDLLVEDSSSNAVPLTLGGSGTVLRSDGSDPAWTALSTTDVSEGTNEYWTQGRFDSAFGLKELDDLLDINAPTPSDGDVLTYSGGSVNSWIAQAPAVGSAGAITLDELEDVNVATPSDGDVLLYAGGSISEWQPGTIEDFFDHSGLVSINPQSSLRNIIQGGSGSTALVIRSAGSGGGLFTLFDVQDNNENSFFHIDDDSGSIRLFIDNMDSITVNTDWIMTNNKRVWLTDSTGLNARSVKLIAPANVTPILGYNFVFPVDTGNADEFLKTDGNGNTSWASIGSINSLDDISDVNVLTPSEGQVLTYVGGSINEWQASDLSAISEYTTADFLVDFAAQELDDLLDVNAATPSDGDVLTYLGGSINEWQPGISIEFVAGNDVSIVYDDVAGTLTIASVVSLIQSIMVVNPGASEDISMFFTTEAITIMQLTAVLLGSTTPSVTWTIRFGSDRSAAGTEVVTGGTETTSITAGSVVTSFNDATIPADSYVWFETTVKSGTVNEINVTVEYQTS